jgi:4-hydroxyproline epimerase
MQRIKVIDSHTEGEPTRIIVDGGPDLSVNGVLGTVAQQREVFRTKFDHIRSAVVNEPRGCDHLVGAMICKPANPRAVCGVIFFNNVGFLNGCGHGTIGLAVTLRHLGLIGAGTHIIETPVGEVLIELGESTTEGGGIVSITNVPSYRHAAKVEVSFPWEGTTRTIKGDVAWGGNWFFLVDHAGEYGHGLDLSLKNLDLLTRFSCAVRDALERSHITGNDNGHIDHIELFGPPTRPDCKSRNFVLCPGKEYDRSPCGTGTSAKLACLAADAKLNPGDRWGQESIIGSAFFGSYATSQTKPGVRTSIVPQITGTAWIVAESCLLLQAQDLFVYGIRIAADADSR